MICKYCGTQLPDIAKFCFNCGKTVDVASEETDEKNIENDAEEIKDEVQESIAEEDNAKTVEEESEQTETVQEEQAKTEEEPEQTETVQEEQAKTEEEPEQTETAQEDEQAKDEEKPEQSTTKKEKTEDKKVESWRDKIKKEMDAAQSKKATEDDADDETEEEHEKGGYSIMVDPDYVPPVIKEEKPLFEEHIDYQAIYAKKAEKIEKIALRVGTIVGILAAVIAVCVIGYKLFMSHQFKSAMDTARDQLNSGNYEQAINTLEDAKQLKGADEKEIVMLLADVYVEMDDADRAMEEILKLYNAKSEPDTELYAKYQEIKNSVIPKISKEEEAQIVEEIVSNEKDGSDEYKAKLNEAAALIKAGDYDGAIAKCKEAGKIDDTIESVYMVYASAYAGKNDYKMAVTILDKGIANLNEKAGKSVSDDYSEMLDKYKRVEEGLGEYADFMGKLYKAMNDVKTIGAVNDAVDLLQSDDFAITSAVSDVTYYTEEDGFTGSVNEGAAMAVYNNGYVYFGDFKGGKREGQGIFMAVACEDGNIKYSLYKGAWSNDLPDGKGTLIYVENFSTDDLLMSVTTGTFKAGYEDGKMSRNKTVAGTKWGTMEYSVKKGVPVPLKNKDGKTYTNKDGDEVLGYHYFNDKPTYLVTIVKGSLYGVDGLGLSLEQ